jgi:glycerol-3-phosphate acyltransferase PlsY
METAWRITLLIMASYLLGAVPFSYIAGRLLRGIDLREHGSGNLGAANTFRVLGRGAAIPVLLADIGKGYLAVRLVPIYGLEGYQYVLLAALIVIIGHNYSAFVRFAGGKGVGTTAGTFLAMAPIAVLACIVIWIVVLLISRIVSLASIVSAACLPAAVAITDRSTHVSVLYLSIVVALFVIYKHRSNIRRLREGTEKRIF